MTAIKTWLIAGGSILVFLGITCLPIGFGASPKRDLSRFHNYADLGAFLHTGLGLIAVGITVIVTTLLGAALLEWKQRAAKARRKGSRQK